MLHAGPFSHGVARAVLEELADDVLKLAEDAAVGVGAKVLAFDIVAAGVEKSGIGFVSDAEVGVGLVVLEHGVVARLIFFDEGVFEKQGVDFGGDDGDASVVDMADEHLDFSTLVVVVGEIGGDTALEVAGLADIYDLAVGVEVLVDTGTFGDGLEPQGDAVDVWIDG